MNIAAATRKFINSKNPASSGFLPLDKIIENNTSIRIQHKTVTLSLSGTSGTATATIDSVDTSKSIIRINSYVFGHYSRGSSVSPSEAWITSVTATLKSATQIEVAWTSDVSIPNKELPVSVEIITFGSNVNQS
mgnify:CR=1 FL=1